MFVNLIPTLPLFLRFRKYLIEKNQFHNTQLGNHPAAPDWRFNYRLRPVYNINDSDSLTCSINHFTDESKADISIFQSFTMTKLGFDPVLDIKEICSSSTPHCCWNCSSPLLTAFFGAKLKVFQKQFISLFNLIHPNRVHTYFHHFSKGSLAWR